MGGLNSGPGPGITLLIAIVVVLTQTALAAPVHEDEEAQESNSHALAESHGCYYNFQHYNEGERILTNEPCLNCTCRNRMLMCYLRVCPFTKGIGQNCTVEKVPGQCCPIITCPEVPVQLLTSTTTEHSEGGKGPSHYYGNKGTAVGHLDTNGCNIDGVFYPNGAQVPSSPEKPCELCYCIRNKTACIMQECALHVDGCRPVYEEGQCFPVRYQCDDSPYEEEPTTTIRPAPTPGLIITTTSSEPLECSYNNDIYEDGSRIPTEDPCEHCYCLKGKIACAVQECGAPLEKDGQNCTALPPAPGKCCPDSYQCDNNVIVHAKENFVRTDRKQKFEPKPIEHNDITMTSQGLSSGSEGTTQSGVSSVADAGHPTDSYHPDKVTTEIPELTTNRFDEESRVTEGVTPAKGIAESSVAPEHQQELDKGTQNEKDSRPAKPIGDQKITFPDELQPVKGEATMSPVDHTDAHVIHMSPEKQPHPEIESHKQWVTPQTITDDVLSESSTSSVKDPLIDKLHNIIQDVQSQVGDGKTSQMPEEVDIQTTTQSQKGHFTEKPDELSHLPHSSTPTAEVTNTTKESSPEDTNILNQIQGIIQGIYSHVTDSIISTKQPESTTQVGQLPGQQPSVSEKEGIAGSYSEKHPEGSKHPESSLGVTDIPKRPIGTDYPEGVTEHSGTHRPVAPTKHPQKVGSHEGSYGTPDDVGSTGRPEGTTKYPEISYGTQYPEELGERPKDPAAQKPESVEVTGKPYDPSKYPEALKPDHHLSEISGKPEHETQKPEGVTGQYPVDSKHPQNYKPEKYPDDSKFSEGVSGKPEEHTIHPDEKYPDGTRPTEHYPESGKVTDKDPSGLYSEKVQPPGQIPVIKPTSEYPELTGVTEESQHQTKYPEGVSGQYPTNADYSGIRPTGKYPESAKPHDHSQYPEGTKPSEKYPDRHKPIGEHTEFATGGPEDETLYPFKPIGQHPTGSLYPEPAGETEKPQDENKYPEGVTSTEEYPVQTKRPDVLSGKPGGGVVYPDKVKPSHEYSTEPDLDGVTEKPEDYTKYPEGVTGRPDQIKHPHKPSEQHPVDSKYPEPVPSSGEKPEFKPSVEYPEGITEQPHDKNKYPIQKQPGDSPSPTKPEDTLYGTEYPESSGYSTDYPTGVSGKPTYPDKMKPQQYPGGFKPTEKSPEYSKHPERDTEKPEDSTKYPASYDTEYTESLSGGRPKDPTKYPEGVQSPGEYSEQLKPITSHPEHVAGKPDHQTKHPEFEKHQPSTHYSEDIHSSTQKYPHGGKPTFEDDGIVGSTENVEDVTGRPTYDKYPSRPGYPSRPVKLPQSTEFPDGGLPTEQYPETVTGRPQDHTKYPAQRPGVFKPTEESPDDSKYPEEVTGKPEHSTKYPYGQGTEHFEGVSGRPKEPSKYPEGVRPSDRYPDVSKYPEYPEGVTGRPEGTTYYPEGQEAYGTEYPGASGSPKDPSKYPGGRPAGVPERPGEVTKYPDGVRPGFKPTEKYPHKPEGETDHPESEVTAKPQDTYPDKVKPTGQYPSDSKHPEGMSGRPSGSTEPSEGFRPTDYYTEEGTSRPNDLVQYPTDKPTGEAPGDLESVNAHADGVTKRPEEETTYTEGSFNQYPVGSKYPSGSKPDDHFMDPSVQDHTKYPFDYEHSQKPVENVYGTEYPDSTDKAESGYEETSIHPSGSTQDTNSLLMPTGSAKPQESSYSDTLHGAEYPEKITNKPEIELPHEGHGKPYAPSVHPEKPTSTEYPKGGKPSQPYPGPGFQDEPFGTGYVETTESEYGTEYPESGTKYPMLSNYPTRHPVVGDKLQKKPMAEDGTSTELLGGSTTRPDLGSYPSSGIKRPVLKPEGTAESDVDIPERLKPSGIGHHPSEPGSTGHPSEKPENDIYGTEYPEADPNTERPHYTSKYPEKPSAEDQLLITDQPDSKVTSHLADDKHPIDGGNKVSAGDTKYPSETSTKSPYFTSKRPLRPAHPEDSKLSTKDTAYGTEYPTESITDKHPAESERPSEPGVEDGSKYPNVEDKNKYPESVTSTPSGYPSKPVDQPHGTEFPGFDQDKYPASVKPDFEISHKPAPGTEYPQAGITEHPKGKPQHPTKYPEGLESSTDKTVTQNPEGDADHYPHETMSPLGQYSGTQFPEGVTKQPEYPEDSKQPDQSPTKTANATKESSPNESTNIVNQIQGIIQGIYSQVTESIMSTLRPESTTAFEQEASKPQEGDHYPHSGQTVMEQSPTTALPDGVKYPEHLQGVTGKPQSSTQYPETDNRFPEGTEGHPDRFTPGASTKYPENIGSDKGTYPTKYPDQTGHTGRPEGSNEYTDGDKPYGTEYPDASGRPREPTKFPQDNKSGQHSEGFQPTEPNSIDSKYQDRFTEKPYDGMEVTDGVTGYHPVDSKYPQESKPGQITKDPKYPEGTSGAPEDHTLYPEGVTGHYPDHSKYPGSIDGTDKTGVNKNPEAQSSGEYPDEITERPEEQTIHSEKVRPTEQYPFDSKFPEGDKSTGSYLDETGKPYYPSKYPDSQHSNKDPEKLEDTPHGTEYPERRPEHSTKYPEEYPGTEYPEVSGRPKEPSKHPESQLPEEYKPGQQTHDTKPTWQVDSKYPSKVSGKPEEVRPEEYPERITEKPEHHTKYPEHPERPGVSGSPPSKYPETVKPYHPRPTGSPYGTETTDATGRPDETDDLGITSKYPETQKPEISEAYGTDYPEAATHPPGLYPVVSKRPVSRPKPSTEYPEESTGRPEKYPQSTDYPTKDEYITSTPVEKAKPDSENLNEISGTPHVSSKYPEYEVPSSTEYPETTDSEYGVHRPHKPSKYPDVNVFGTDYPHKISVTTDKNSQSGKPTFEDDGIVGSTENLEDVTGKPTYDQYPSRPGYPSRPVKLPQSTEFPDGGLPTEQYPETVTGRPQDHTKYPAQRPGVFKPTEESPDDSKYPEELTGKPEHSTKYPYGQGTEEHFEGVSGRPKEPSKYPEGVRPSDRYPDVSKYPEYPESVTGRPEGTTYYPEGEEAYGTEYPGASGSPKDPSKYPGARPAGVPERPGEDTTYPDGVRPGFKPTEKYPHKPESETDHPGSEVTAKPQDAYSDKVKPTGQYPSDSKHPEGISGRPSGSTEPSEGFRPTDYYTEEGTGRPEYQTQYPQWLKPMEEYPEKLNTTGPYSTDSKHPDGSKPIEQDSVGHLPAGDVSDDSNPEKATLAPGSKFPDKGTDRPSGDTKYSEGVKPTTGYSDEYEPTENMPFGITKKPDDLIKYPQELKPSDKHPSISEPSNEHQEGFKPTEKYPETSSPAGKPEDTKPIEEYPVHSKYPDIVKPTEKYPHGSNYPSESDVGTEYPESSTKTSEEYGTEYSEGVSKEPKDPTKYPTGVQLPEGHKPTEQYVESIATSGKPQDPSKLPEGQYPEEVKPDKSKPTSESSSEPKYPENVTGGPQDQTDHPHIITGRPEGPTHYPEGDSHVTELPSVNGRPKEPSKQPGGSQFGQYPEEVESSEQYPEKITIKPEEHAKHPDKISPSGHYPDGSKYPEPSGITEKPHEVSKYPGVRPTEQYEVHSKRPEDYLTGFKPTEKYPQEIMGKPEDETKYPEGVKPSQQYPEEIKPDKHPGGSKPTAEHPGFVATEQYPYDVSGNSEGQTKYPEVITPSTQHPEQFTPDDKVSLKPDDVTGLEHSQSVTGQYPGTTSRPHYSTQYPAEGKPVDKEGVTDRPAHQTGYPEGAKPTEEYPEGFKPTGIYSVDPEHLPSATDKASETSKYPHHYPEEAKQPEEITGKPQDYTKYPEESSTDKPYDSGKHPQDVTGKPGDKTKYPGEISENYPAGSNYPEDIKPLDQHTKATEKPQGVSKYPEDSEHPELSKPSAEYPHGQKPSEKYPDVVTGIPESVTDYPEGDSQVTEYLGSGDKPKDPEKSPGMKPPQHSEGFEPTGQHPIDIKVTDKPEDVSKYTEQHTTYYPTGITSTPEDHTKYPESLKPEHRPHQPENEFAPEFSQGQGTGRPEHQTEYPERFPGQYPGVSGRPEDKTKDPEDGAEGTHPLEEHYPTGSKQPSRPYDHITVPDNNKPSEQSSEGFNPLEKQPELSTDEQYPTGVTDKNAEYPGETVRPEYITKYPGETVRPEYITKYPGVRPKPGSSKHPVKPESTSDGTEYSEVTTKYPELAFGTEYPDSSKVTVQVGSKYPEGTSGRPTKLPGFKPSPAPGLTTILPSDFEEISESEVGFPDLIEYTKRPKPEQPFGADAVTTIWPIHKYPIKHPQRPDGLGDESFGTEYPETTEPDFEYDTQRPDVTGKYPDHNKPGVSRPKPGIEYLPHGSEKPSSQTHGLDENSLPSKETQTDRMPVTEENKPVYGLKPSSVDDYPSRPRPTIPGEGLYNEDVTQKPSGQTTSGTGVHPTVELTPDVKIPEGDSLSGQPEKYPSTEPPVENLSGKPVDGEAIEQQFITNRQPETTSDDDLINKLHNIISGIQSQTSISPEQSTLSPQGVDEIGKPAPTHMTETHQTTKVSHVTDRPQEGFGATEDATQPVFGQSLSPEDSKVSSEQSTEPTGSDKTRPPHFPTESTFHTVTPQDEIQKETSSDKPLHVVYPTYYPDGVVTRKPGAKPEDGDKKVTVTPQSTHEKTAEQEQTHTVYDIQTEISSETATTPGVVIVEEVHTEVHSERPTKRPIFGPAITQPSSSDLTTHSGYQTEVPESTKPSYVTVTPIGTNSESDNIMHLYSSKHPATDTPTTQSFITEVAVQQHTRFPSRKTTQTPVDELTTQKPQGASYVPYKLVNSTKIYYPEKEQSQKPHESGPYDGYDQIPYEVINGTKFFYPNRIATEQPTTSASLGMYVPYKIINGTKVYYTQDPPQDSEKYDGLDYVPFEIKNGTKVFYPERVPTTPSPTTAMYVPFKIVNGNKLYYPKDAKDEPKDVPDEYDGFDYVPFESVNGKKVFHLERVPNHTPAGSDYVPYKLVNNNKVYYPKDAQNEQDNIPKGYDGFDSIPYDIIENEKVYYPEKASPQKPSAMFVPYKLVNGTKVYYPKLGQDKPTQIPEGYDGFDYIPYDTVNGTKVFHPERITPKPVYYPNKMFVPYKVVNNTKVFYPKDAQSKPRPLKPEYDGVEYLPYDVLNGTKVFHPPTVATPAMYVPYVIKNGEKVYDLKKATQDPKGVPEGYDGLDYLPYEVKDGGMIFYPEKIATPEPKEGAMYVPYKLINGTKVYYADRATDKPEDVPGHYDGFDYIPYKLQNGNKIFYPDKIVPTTTPVTPKKAMYVPYKLMNGKKVYQTDKATENPQDIPEEFDGFDYIPYDEKNGSKVFYPEQVTPVLEEGAMYVPYKLINGTKVYYADKAADKPEDVPGHYDGFDYIPYKLQNGNKIFYPDKIGSTTTPVTPKKAMYVPYKLIDGKKVYQTDKATENPQDMPEEFDGFDYVPYDEENGNKVFYPERVKPTPTEGAMYVPYKLNNGTKVYYADKATGKPEDISKDYDGFDYIPYELQNGNKLFYPDRVATPTNKKAMYVPYKLDNGKKVYQTDKATENPQGIPEKFDGFDYIPYEIENDNKVFYPEKAIPDKGSEYVPYKIVKGMKIYHPEKAADKAQEIPEEFDGFDYLPFKTQNGNKIFYPDRVTQPPKGAIYVPYKLVNGKKVYNPNKATNSPQDIPKGYDGCDHIPYEIKNGNKIFHPEQITTPAPTQGSMYVPYKLINGTKVYYADKATDKQEDVPAEYDGLDYLPYELQNGNKIFYPDKATTPAPNKSFKYIPYKLVNGRKVYYPDRAADTQEDIPKGYDGYDYLPIEYITKPQESQGMFVPYKTINGTKVYYPQEAHKRPHPLSDEYSGLDYMPYETINGTKVFYPEREPQAMYVPYKIINGSKVFYPNHAQRTPEEIPAGYDGLDYVPYDIINGSQIFHPDRVPEYQGMFVPYKIVNGKKVFYPKYAQHKPMLMDGYDGFDYLPYENVNGTKVFKPEIPEQAMYVPYKIINGTKVYYPKFAQRKPEVPVGYDGSDYIPYELVNGTKIFDPSIKPAMYVPYKIMDGTKIYYPKHAQHKPESIPNGYDGHDYLPYEIVNGNKIFKPGQATPQEQITPEIKQAMYVPYRIVNGTKVYYPKFAQNKPENIPDGYDGHDYLPYEIVNGNKVFKPEQMTPQIKQAMYVPYKIVNGTKVYYPKYAQNNPYLVPAGYDGFDYIPYEVVNDNKVFHPEKATTAPPPPKQAMYVPYKLINGTKAYYPKHAQDTPTPVPFSYDGLDYLPYEVVNGTKIFEPQPHTKPTYLLGMFVPYKLSNNTKIFYPKDAHNKPHYVPQGYDGADYVPYEAVNNTKLFYPELISMAQPSTANIPGIYVPFRLVNNKKVFYPKEATPFPPTVRYPYDGVAFVPYKSSVPSEIIYVDEDELSKPHIPSGHVPGEGNCYLNNRTYSNNSDIAPVSPCQARCTCISSVVRCVRVKCPPPPQNKLDCSPVYREGTCCPTYTCGESENDYSTTVGYPKTKAPEGTSHGHDFESTTAFTDLTSQKRPGSAEEEKPGQQSEEYHLHKPPKPSEHESLGPYDSVEGQLSPEEDYDVEDEEPYGPGTCRYAGKVYVSAQQIPRDDPCDFCFCFRSDIICLQQSCPPPIPGCRDEPIEGFCCPRYECHVKMATLLNVTSTTTTTTTTLPPHFFPHAYKGSATRTGCFVQGKAYRVGQPIPSASGPCMDCICGGNGRMKCEPKVCTPEPMIRKMMSPSESTTTSTYER